MGDALIRPGQVFGRPVAIGALPEDAKVAFAI